MSNSTKKIQTLGQLGSTCEELRAQGKRIAHCHGVFDLLHIGHIKHFEAARKLGDVLVVTLTADAHVNKGPGRPAFSENLRAEAVAALAVVDYVAINTSASAADALNATRPYRYVKGSDYRGRVPTAGSKMQSEIDLVRSFGGDIAFTDEPQFSSSKLINEFLSPFSPLVQERLKEAKSHISEEEIPNFFSELERSRGVVHLQRGSERLFSALFPHIAVQLETTCAKDDDTASNSDNLSINLHLGVTEISAQSVVTGATFSMPPLSETSCASDLLTASARVLSNLKSPNPYLCAVFLAVLNQEARPGLTLAALRKVLESILK